jgi:hypothetical protein
MSDLGFCCLRRDVRVLIFRTELGDYLAVLDRDFHQIDQKELKMPVAD